MADGIRKPRTTHLVLEDLDVAIEALAGEIEQLADFDKPYPDATSTPTALQLQRRKRHEHLVRAHTWLSRHVAAARQGRKPEGDDSARDDGDDRSASQE